MGVLPEYTMARILVLLRSNPKTDYTVLFLDLLSCNFLENLLRQVFSMVRLLFHQCTVPYGNLRYLDILVLAVGLSSSQM